MKARWPHAASLPRYLRTRCSGDSWPVLDANRHTSCLTFVMKRMNWSAEKNQQLMSERSVSFEEEQELLEAYESGEFASDLDADRREELARAAEETFKKDKRINIRISSRDLEALQRRALEEGLPYQSLVSSILHKYVSGVLKDISANKSGQRER